VTRPPFALGSTLGVRKPTAAPVSVLGLETMAAMLMPSFRAKRMSAALGSMAWLKEAKA
jgi:hypothetical protein